MRWLLSVPDDFSLQGTLRCSRVFLCEPTTVAGFGDRLERIERLSTHTVTLLTIYQSTSGLFIHTDSTLTGSEMEEASARIWRMLRLSEDLRCLEHLLHDVQDSIPLRCLRGRLIRGTTFWEDIVVSALARWNSRGSLDLSLVQTLVNCAGSPFPRNPTRHAFPDADSLLGQRDELELTLGHEEASRVVAIAQAWQTGAERWRRWQEVPEAAAEFVHLLQREFGLRRHAVSFLLMRLGRYSFPPDVLGAAGRPGASDQQRDDLTARRLAEIFNAYPAWAGLIYWLVDWERVTVMDDVSWMT